MTSDNPKGAEELAQQLLAIHGIFFRGGVMNEDHMRAFGQAAAALRRLAEAERRLSETRRALQRIAALEGSDADLTDAKFAETALAITNRALAKLYAAQRTKEPSRHE